MRLACFCVALLASGCFFELEEPFDCSLPGSEVVVITTGHEWKYLDTGELVADWAAPSFDDGNWPSGPSELGYGDDNEATVVGYGPDPNKKYVTTYFRHAFEKPVGCTKALLLELKRDDGAVVYLNGVEVMRSNMPGGIVTPQTRPVTFVSNQSELEYHPADVDPDLLVGGKNVMAAEVHQFEPDGTDISFDLRLTARVAK